jgi:hypothetical protein
MWSDTVKLRQCAASYGNPERGTPVVSATPTGTHCTIEWLTGYEKRELRVPVLGYEITRLDLDGD